jgi:ADP-ribose pyrophosphatase
MRVEILSDEIVGREGGFLAIRRLRCVNVRGDGSRSEPYLCDFLVRPKGIDAVVVVVYAREQAHTRVLLRDGIRLPLAFGRGPAPVPDGKSYQVFRETVAGIIEVEDQGRAGIQRRAALEVEEEAGFHVSPDDVELLGAGTFASPGAMPEKLWFCAVEVDPAKQATPTGDGSPMEEGAALEWLDLDAAVAACVRGDIEDAKTEIVLRRLADRLRP